jgi:uncharacterized protein YjbI with pentapeptide repeats
MARDIFIALLAVGVTFTLDTRIATRQERAENSRAELQEALENIRFVRERSGDPASIKPFGAIQLSGANLSGLDLGCETRPATNCATFENAKMQDVILARTNLKNADLAGADLTRADLSSVDFTNAYLGDVLLTEANLANGNLTNANLTEANLTEANLTGADLTDAYFLDAILTAANLTYANLTGADLTGADLTGACFDDSTTWPLGYQPPAADCTE